MTETTYAWAAAGDDLPPEVTVTVVEALVPALVWPSVPVVREADEELTVVDRFVLHSALAMGATGPAEVHEVTGIAEPAVARIAGRLVDQGLLVRDGKGYQPVGPAARPALDRRAVRQGRTERWSFLHLPYSDDVIAFDPGEDGGTVVLLHDVDPCAVAPMPNGSAAAPVGEFLRERASTGRVAGLPDGLVDIADVDGTVPGECPVYRCSGTVERTADGPLARLDVLDPTEADDRWGVLVLGASRLIERWQGLVGELEPALDRWRVDGGEATARAGELGPEVRLNTVAAEQVLGEGIALSRPAVVTVRTADAVVEGVVRLRPSDRAAAERFALDDAVQAVLDTEPAAVDRAGLARLLDEAAAEYEVPREDLGEARMERLLWDGGHFRHLYAVRADRDFGYA